MLSNIRVCLACTNLKNRIYIIRSFVNLSAELRKLNNEKQYRKALDLFNSYEEKHPETISDVALVQALKSSTYLKKFSIGLKIYSKYQSRLTTNSYGLASLITLFVENNDINRAKDLFNKSTVKTTGIYGALMKGLIKNRQYNEAINLFFQIPNPDEANYVLFFYSCSHIQRSKETILKIYKTLPRSFEQRPNILSSVVNALIKCNELVHAEQVFSKIKKPMVNTYGNLMKALNDNNQFEKTLQLYEQMKINQIEVNSAIYLLLINACANIGVFPRSQLLFDQIPKHFQTETFIQNALIDMWGKSGCVQKAKAIFDSLLKPDTLAYTSMINSYGLNGMTKDAISLFERMPEKLMNEATYVSVLNACSHGGLVEKARSIFTNVNNKTEKIYTVMVDCLCRASLFDEAVKLIDDYERQYSPSAPMLMALLSGCRNRCYTDLAEKIFNRIEKHFSKDKKRLAAALVLLSNAYASTNNLDKSLDLKDRLKEDDLKKTIGFAWTEINGRIHKFGANDQSHAEIDKIYDEMKKISQEVVADGHQYDAVWITRTLKANETVESALSAHSERLAIAYNFVVNPSVKSIYVSKNLRVCGDCHEVTKRIAAIRKCEIIVRDANRFHHFTPDGKCSCNDYF